MNSELWTNHPPYRRLLSRLEAGESVSAGGLVSQSRASFLAALTSDLRGIPKLFVGDPRLAKHLGADALPSSHASPLEGLAEGEQHFARVCDVLHDWHSRQDKLYLAVHQGLAQPVCPPEVFERLVWELVVGRNYIRDELLSRLMDVGYRRVENVYEPGQVAVRGEVMDLYPANGYYDPPTGQKLPLRLGFAGDELEYMRPFSVWNQRSLPNLHLQSWPIAPMRPVDLRHADLDHLLALENELPETQVSFWRRDLDKIFEDGWQRFLPWLGVTDVPLSHFPKEGLVVVEDLASQLASLETLTQKRQAELEAKLAQGAIPPSQRNKLRELVDLPRRAAEKLRAPETRVLSLFPFDGGDIDLETRLVPQFRANVTELEDYIRSEPDATVVLATSHRDQLERDLYPLPSNVSFVEPGEWDKGFAVGKTKLLTDLELFARRPVVGRKARNQAQAEEFIPLDLDSIRPGDLLVHLKHGIGKFRGLKQVHFEGVTRDYLSIEYARGDTLSVPVEQMNMLTLYRGTADPKLSKLGGTDWERTKKKVRQSVAEIADELLAMYAKRATAQGPVMEPDTPWQAELEEAFPYRETPDQLQASEQIKSDLETGQVMDRLLCGDVGFGKTEVIIRAAFKVIMSGCQVALLAPTTILAQQHYRSFRERLDQLPVRMALLTGASKDKDATYGAMSQGEVDLVIGTHALLAKKVRFRNLGMLVIDEEQKFGVRHKEKLKALRANVPVLTVSATPIPRTMHMALSGIRDMSLIKTPPPGRVPIKTSVMRYDDQVVRSAILRELERGGQVFYLHNRVDTIETKALQLMKLVPEASFRVAHGQMSEASVSEAMSEFMDHEFDVLVATSIIENGLDIPNANTLIVEDAERLGLAQLYQLRGRIGRANDPSRPGVAILLHGDPSAMTETARARLETTARYNNPGSGYQIAVRDMELRGIGNLVGAEQHGKVNAIGFELYCELLKEAIHKHTDRGVGPEAELEDKPVLDLKVDAHLPARWIPDEAQRLKEYRRLAEVESETQLEALSAEWPDRFGSPPPPVERLLQVVRLRIRAAKAGIRGQLKPVRGTIACQVPGLDPIRWQRVWSGVPSWVRDRLKASFPSSGDPYLSLEVGDLTSERQLALLEAVLEKL